MQLEAAPCLTPMDVNIMAVLNINFMFSAVACGRAQRSNAVRWLMED